MARERPFSRQPRVQPLSERASAAQVEAWLEEQFSDRRRSWRRPWRRGAGHLWSFYCGYCGVSRRLRISPHLSLRHFAQVGLTTLVAAALCWPWFGARGLFLLLPFWSFFEVVYRLRVRAELPCDHCGFDPALYLADVQLARQQMKRFWDLKLEKRRNEGGEANPSLTGENAQR